jgi:hypothetical protein
LKYNSCFFSYHFDDNEALDCFLNHPPLKEMQFPLSHGGRIQKAQFKEKQLQNYNNQCPLEYPIMDMRKAIQLICQVCPNQPWRIPLLAAIVDNIIKWYHLVLGHVGIVCLNHTICTHFVHPH